MPGLGPIHEVLDDLLDHGGIERVADAVAVAFSGGESRFFEDAEVGEMVAQAVGKRSAISPEVSAFRRRSLRMSRRVGSASARTGLL